MRVISSAVFARDSNSAVIIKGLEIDATRGVNSPSLFVCIKSFLTYNPFHFQLLSNLIFFVCAVRV